MNRIKKIVCLISALPILSCTSSVPIENLGLECPEWKAEWITAPWEGTVFDEEKYDRAAENILSGQRDTTVAAPEFSRTFELKRKPARATAYFCGLGFGELFIDGRKVGTDLLCPNLTSYNYRPGLDKAADAIDGEHFSGFHTQYMSYDVTGMLHKGENTVSAIVGCGFYAKNYTTYKAFGTRRMICQIDIEYPDGGKESLCSDTGWKVRRSSILMDDMFRGEAFDANYKGVWQQAVGAAPVETSMVPQRSPSDKVMEILEPQTITKISNNEWRVDFGDYISGWARIKNFTAEKGTTIEIVHECEEKGNGIWRFTSDGSTWNWSPEFTWYAFRTVVVKGWPGELKKEDIEAQVVYSNMATVGHFECSNPLLNRINRIWWRTETDNLHLCTASDCPHREKRPYTGDGEVSCIAVMHTFDAASFYRKWLRDIRDCQNEETGYVPNVAPWLGGGGGVPWGSAICIMTWEHYKHYGEVSILEENYQAMKNYLRFLSSWKYNDGTIHQKMCKPGETEPYYWLNLGEWCPPYNLAGENLVHTWYYWLCASYTAKTAAILEETAEAEYYGNLAESIKDAFHKKFYDEKEGSYGSGSGIRDKTGYGTGDAVGVGDGSNIFALAMGVPEDRLEKVLETVKNEFKANDGHFNTGIYGTSILGETLCRYNLDDYAYTAMTKTDFPSFGYWVEQGADTTWEQWNGKNSRNHPMFGGGLVWLYRCLAGLNSDENEPGFKHIIIRPRPAGDLKWVKYSTMTPQGKVGIEWNISDNGVFDLDISVPEGARTTLFLPGDNEPIEAASGHYSKKLF